MIISIPNNSVFDKKLENAVNSLELILNKHLNFILKIIKINQIDKDYNINNIPLDLLKSESIINPHNGKDDHHEFFTQ